MPDPVRSENPAGEAGAVRPLASGFERAEDRTESHVPSTARSATPTARPVTPRGESTADRYIVRQSVPLRESSSAQEEDDAYVFGGDAAVEDDAPTVIRTDQVQVAAEHHAHDHDATDRAGPGIPASGEPRHAPFAVQYLAGETLSHFRLDEFVGGGGMGCVFRATDLTLGRTVAVKVLSARGRDADLLARFRNEAQNAARLDHENIARVYFVGADKGWNFIVFEFIEGTNLREVIEREGPLPLDRALDYVLQICDALEHAASRDVVHRDIKPSNVLITPGGRAKLVDMGLARLRQIETPAGDLTASGVTLGTFDYISPEQARDPRFADVRSDIYSLGCTLFFILTGEPPFAEGSGLQKLLRHTSDHPPDPRDVRPDLPERLTKILWKSLAKAPQDRYQSPSEFAGDLAMLAEELGYTDALRGRTLVIAAHAPPSPLSRFAVWGTALAFLFAFTLLADAYFLPRSGPSVPALEPILAEGPAATIPEVDATNSGTGAPTPVSPGTETVEPSTDAATPPVVPRGPNDPRNTSASGATTSPELSATGGASSPTTNGLTGTSPSAVAIAESASGNASSEPRPSDAPSADDGSSSISFGSGESRRVDVYAAALARDLRGGEAGFSVGSSSDSSNPPGTASATVRPQAVASTTAVPGENPVERLIVGDVSELLPGDRVVPDLESAVQLMERSPTVRTLELRFHDWRRCPPIRLSNRNVTIAAANGYRPGLLLAPPDAKSPRPAIDLRNTGITLENVDLRWEVPLDAKDDLAMIEARGNTPLSVIDSCVTISNLSDLGSPAERDVAFIRIVSEASAQSTDDSRTPLPSPGFSFSDAVFRGEATLFRAVQGASFSCHWTNGLFVSSERLVFASGRPVRDAWGNERIDLSLDHVTAIVPEGLAAFDATEDERPYFPRTKLSVRDSIVKARKSAPLIEHLGDQVEAMTSLIGYVGRGDFYPETEIVWRIVPKAEPAQSLDMEAMQAFDWFKVPAPQSRAYWARLPQVPVSQQTPDDYRLSEDPTNPALFGSEYGEAVGADILSLPDPMPAPTRETTPRPTSAMPRP